MQMDRQTDMTKLIGGFFFFFNFVNVPLKKIVPVHQTTGHNIFKRDYFLCSLYAVRYEDYNA